MHFSALLDAPKSAIQTQPKPNLKCTFKCIFKCNLKSATSGEPSHVSLCRLLNASLRAALKYCQVHYHCTDKSTINFLCSFKCSLEWNLRCTFKCSIECYLNFTIYWIILYSLMTWKLHEKMKLKCNLKWSF